MKTCRLCNQDKEDTEFYKGLRQCKPCYIKKVKQYRENNIEKVRAYDRERGCRQTAAYLREYRRKNKDKEKAHRAVNYAVSKGNISKPNHCQGCGEACAPHGHHEDYSRKLDVTWLCPTCHRFVHVMRGD